jgi:hypothetical protein
MAECFVNKGNNKITEFGKYRRKLWNDMENMEEK